jgi:hypothetical protein
MITFCQEYILHKKPFEKSEVYFGNGKTTMTLYYREASNIGRRHTETHMHFRWKRVIQRNED